MCEKGSSVAIIPIKGIIAAFLFHIKLLCNDFIKNDMGFNWKFKE